MTENLKRCPFCGGEAKCIEFYGLYHVICCNCHIAGKDCPRRESAVSAWNNRPIEDLKDDENARLREALEEIKNNVKEAQDPVYSFHFDLDSKHGMFILETAENALKGDEE